MNKIPDSNNISCIESLLYKNINNSRWYPISVDAYRQDVSQGIFSGLNYYYKSNIAYNLQYLEYIELQLRELNFSSVIISPVLHTFLL